MQNRQLLSQKQHKLDIKGSLLTVSQQKVAAEALGAAFSRDPFMSYVFPKAITRERNIAAVFYPLIRCNMTYGNVEIARNGEGILLWISGKRLPLPLQMLVRSGMIWTPFRVGQAAFKRLENHEAFCDQAVEAIAPEGFAYMWVVGVHPDSAGKGLGKQMIQSAIGTMRRQGHSACILRTDNEKNVALYEHLGFEQVSAGIEPSSQLPYWLLLQTLT
ncbi:MAG: GNAT family N-acetyltransferase [Cyanobacteria bacterium J06614_10]